MSAPEHLEVRAAVTGDLAWIIDELSKFSDQFGTQLGLFPRDPIEAWRVVQSLIDNHVVLIAERPEYSLPGITSDLLADTTGAKFVTRVGFIAGTLTPHPFNSEIHVLQEVFWWVRPEERRSKAGRALLDAFEGVAVKRDVDWVVMALERNSTVPPEWLEGRGYHLHERSYLREMP